MKMLFSAIRAAFWAACALMLAAVGFIAFAAAAYAAGDAVGTAVSIPWGDWLSSLAPGLLDVALAALAAALAWVLKILPASIANVVTPIVKSAQVEQLLARAVSYGINAVAGAAHDKVLSVDVGNQVVAEALEYAIAHGPAWLTEFTGDSDQIAQMIIARLKLEAGATVSASGPTITGATTSAPATTTAAPA